MKKSIIFLLLAVVAIQSCQRTEVIDERADYIVIKDQHYTVSDSITTSVTNIDGRVFSAVLALPRKTGIDEAPESSEEKVVTLKDNREINEDELKKFAYFNLHSARELSREMVSDQVIVKSLLYQGTLGVLGNRVPFYYTIEKGEVLDRYGNSIQMPYPELTSSKLKKVKVLDPTENEHYLEYDVVLDLEIVYDDHINIATVDTVKIKVPTAIPLFFTVSVSDWENDECNIGM